MAHIYIALVDTPGFFASLIRHYLGQKYVHVVLSLDEQLSEAYSFGRRNPYIPLIAGFEREWSRQIAGAFPTAEYRICELDCTGEQKEAIRERLHKDYKNRFHMHYAAAGLLALLCHRKFYLKNPYTCSSYLAEGLGEQGIFISEKHFSLVTPKDVCEYKNCRVVFEGRLSDLIVREEQAVVGMMILLFWQKLLKEHLGGYFFWCIWDLDCLEQRCTRSCCFRQPSMLRWICFRYREHRESRRRCMERYFYRYFQDSIWFLQCA